MYKRSIRKTMDIGALLKCVIIAVLIFAGYHVVTNNAVAKRNEGFENPSSADVPNVVAEKSSNLITTNMSNMIGLLQVSNNRKSYEKLVVNMDPWTQAKVVSSLNALAAQMIADSSDQKSMMSPPTEKTIALMNALNTMTTFENTTLPIIMKYLNNAWTTLEQRLNHVKLGFLLHSLHICQCEWGIRCTCRRPSSFSSGLRSLCS